MKTNEETIPARLWAVPSPDGVVVVVGASLEDQEDALGRLAGFFALGGVVALFLTGLVSWVVAGVALRPVDRMRTEAAAITSSDLGKRLAVPGTRDELAKLSETLNDMLARLEAGLLRERQFVSDASHELRTPLTNLKAEIELALRSPRDEVDLRAALESAGYETNRLIELAEELLVLARAEEGGLSLTLEPVNVRELLVLEADAFRGRSSRSGVDIRVTCAASLVWDLDPQRMRQALANLVDNALRHSPRGGTIEVSATQVADSLLVEVADHGDGIPDTFVANAFEPFTRADDGRTRSHGGAGLGLAITRAIVEAHEGTVVARNRPSGGAAVAIWIPERKA